MTLTRRWYCHVLVLLNSYSHVLVWFGKKVVLGFLGAAWQSIAVSAARAGIAGMDQSHQLSQTEHSEPGWEQPGVPTSCNNVYVTRSYYTVRILLWKLESSSLLIFFSYFPGFEFTFPFVNRARLLSHISF